LGRRDTGGGLVEDQHSGAQPEQADDLQLLALADRQSAHRCVGIEGESEALTQLGQRYLGCGAIESDTARAAQHEVVDDAERQEHQRVLVEHPDASCDRVPG